MLKTNNPKSIACTGGYVQPHSVEIPPNARWLYTAGSSWRPTRRGHCRMVSKLSTTKSGRIH